MDPSQFAELLAALKGIDNALLAIAVIAVFHLWKK